MTQDVDPVGRVMGVGESGEFGPGSRQAETEIGRRDVIPNDLRVGIFPDGLGKISVGLVG